MKLICGKWTRTERGWWEALQQSSYRNAVLLVFLPPLQTERCDHGERETDEPTDLCGGQIRHSRVLDVWHSGGNFAARGEESRQQESLEEEEGLEEPNVYWNWRTQ